MTTSQNTSSDGAPQQKTDWEAIKKEAEAKTAAAEARKAEAEASLAALKAQIGEIPSSGFTGDVKLEEGAGTVEAALLAAKAVETAAHRIVEALPKQEANKTVLLFSASEIPNFQAQIAYNAQVSLVENAFIEAQNTSNKADVTAPGLPGTKREAVAAAGAIGLTLDAINKLVGFFRTDYTVGGVDFTLEDALLVHAVAGLVAGSGKNLDVQLPAVYSPGALTDVVFKILNKIKSLSLLKLGAQTKASRHDEISAGFTEEAGKETNPQNKDDLLNKAKTHKDAADAWKATMGLYDSFISKLTTADDKGIAPLTNVIREGVVAESLLNGNLLLLVKLQKSGGAYYTKKNLFTFFGGMPFYHMGGVVTSFVLLDGKTGMVLVSGVVPIHGGFVKANDLPKRLK